MFVQKLLRRSVVMYKIAEAVKLNRKTLKIHNLCSRDAQIML